MNLSERLIIQKSSTFDLEAAFLLNLSDQGIEDIGPAINECVNLRELDLSRNRITGLSGFNGEKLVKLASLNLVNNNITSLAMLDALPSLHHLHLQGNKLMETGELKMLATKLPSLKSLHFQNLSGMNANPLCGEANYEHSVREAFPFLQVLDGRMLQEDFAIYRELPDPDAFAADEEAELRSYAGPQVDWLERVNSDIDPDTEEDEEFEQAEAKFETSINDFTKIGGDAEKMITKLTALVEAQRAADARSKSDVQVVTGADAAPKTLVD